MARKSELEPGEVVLGKTGADYQALHNHGTLTLTNRRLIWRMGWEVIPLGHLFGQKEVIIPFAGIKLCARKGRAVSVDTPNGEFLFVVGTWPWSTEKSSEWTDKVNTAIRQQYSTKEAEK